MPGSLHEEPGVFLIYCHDRIRPSQTVEDPTSLAIPPVAWVAGGIVLLFRQSRAHGHVHEAVRRGVC